MSPFSPSGPCSPTPGIPSGPWGPTGPWTNASRHILISIYFTAHNTRKWLNWAMAICYIANGITKQITTISFCNLICPFICPSTFHFKNSQFLRYLKRWFGDKKNSTLYNNNNFRIRSIAGFVPANLALCFTYPFTTLFINLNYNVIFLFVITCFLCHIPPLPACI